MRPLIAVIFLLSSCFPQAQEPVDSRNKEIVFRSVNVVPMDKEHVLENQVVVVKDGRIRAMGAASTVKYSKDALVVDAAGKYLMPGLSEMHAHVPPVDDLEPMKDVLLLFAVHGITTIRGMLGHARHLELRAKVKSGEIIGPRFYTSGPSFNGQSVRTTAAADSLVRQQKAAGYDFLKLHPGLTKETFAAMAARAKALKIPFAGHVSFDVGVWRAIDAGYASIDHMDGFIEGLIPGVDTMKEEQTGLFAMFAAHLADTGRIPKLMQGLRDHHIWVVPTQALAERWFAPDKAVEMLSSAPEMRYMSANTLKNWSDSKKGLMEDPRYDSSRIQDFIRLRRRLILACQQQGVGLLLGSDAPQVFNVPGVSTHQELQYLTAAGLSPYEALRTGTVQVGNYLNRAGELGIIKPGSFSDLILLRGNPLEDIKNTMEVEGVMLGNRWLSKIYIDQARQKLVKQ